MPAASCQALCCHGVGETGKSETTQSTKRNRLLPEPDVPHLQSWRWFCMWVCTHLPGGGGGQSQSTGSTVLSALPHKPDDRVASPPLRRSDRNFPGRKKSWKSRWEEICSWEWADMRMMMVAGAWPKPLVRPKKKENALQTADDWRGRRWNPTKRENYFWVPKKLNLWKQSQLPPGGGGFCPSWNVAPFSSTVIFSLFPTASTRANWKTHQR